VPISTASFWSLVRKETEWSEVESRVVPDRIRNILGRLSTAPEPASESIIGERRVANPQQVASLHEPGLQIFAFISEVPREYP